MAEYRMPAEWTEHEGCLMARPTREDLWGSALEEVKGEYADVARAVAAFEPVTMVAPPGHGEEARARCRVGAADGVTVVDLPQTAFAHLGEAGAEVETSYLNHYVANGGVHCITQQIPAR